MSREWYDEVRLISSEKQQRSLGAFELAPLIDVVLMLVIFSLMVTGFIYTPGIHVELPHISAGNAIRGKSFTLTLTADEKVYVEAEKEPIVLLEQVNTELQDFARNSPEGTVIIKADYAVRHGYLLQILTLIRDAGIKSIAFAGEIDSP